MAPSLTKFKEYLGNVLRHRVGLLGSAVQGQELALMFFVDQFQLVSLRGVSDDLGFVFSNLTLGLGELLLH